MARILIVDDEKAIRLTLGEFLHDAGYGVQTAGDAVEAEALLSQHRFDVVVTDIVLPRISGVELLRRIRAQAPEALVLLMTGEPTVETAVESVRAGAYDYLTKPISKELILQAVGRAVQVCELVAEKQRLEQANRDYQTGLERMVEERTHALRQSEAFYQSLVENLPMHILRKDLQGRFTFANPRFCQALGRTLEDIRGRTDADFFPPELVGKYLEDDRRVLATGQPLDLVESHATPAGERRFVQVNKTPLYDFEGRVVGLQCIFRDITEQKQAEDQLRKLARAVEQSPVAILITDRQGRIEFVNPRFTQITGYAPDEVYGKNPRFLKSGETSAEEYRQLWEAITAGDEWRGEFHNRRKDGTLYWETATISPIRDPAGAITHFIAVKLDTSEMKLLENKFLRAQRLGGIGSLASGIAHDLNNILAPVLICVPMLRGEPTPQERQQLLGTIEASVDRAVGIVRQLLHLGHAREGRPIPLQVEHLVREVGKIIRETFPRSIQIALACPSNLRPVLGDATQIHQVLLNLCVNARDAMPDGGRLTLMAENFTADAPFVAAHPDTRPGPYIRVQVADTGCGIPEAVREHIFHPFFTTKPPEQGTGLGLTTVLGIVKNHQGRVEFRSEVGRGTTFEVYLPALVEAHPPVPKETAPAPAPRGHGETILVVDDEAPIRQALKQTLERHGYRVIVAVDGAEALIRYTAHAADIRLVMTDLMMPGLDGASLCRRLQALNSRVPVVISTGTVPSEVAPGSGSSSEPLPHRHWLLKPYDTGSLLRTVAEVLRTPAPT